MPLPFKLGYEAIEFAVKKWLMKNRPIQGLSTIPGKSGPFDNAQIQGTIENYAKKFRDAGKDVNKVTVQEADRMINSEQALKAQRAKKASDDLIKFMGSTTPPKKPDFASGGIARVGMLKGGTAWKEFIERLFIKASNDIRQGKGKWAGLTQDQWIKQHDDLTKMLKKWEWGGKKGLPQGAEQFIGMNDLQVTKAIKGATKKVDDEKLMQKAYDEIYGGSGFSGDYKYDADILAEEYARQHGKVFADLPEKEISKYYDPALKRVSQDMLKRREAQKALKDVEQKIELQMFDTKGRKPNAYGGIAGELHLNQGGRVSFVKGGKVSNGLAQVLGV